MKILYLGLFRFPEGDAAASRVLNNIRIFRDLGHSIHVLSFGGKYREEDCVEGSIFMIIFRIRLVMTLIHILGLKESYVTHILILMPEG